jgi:Na+/phosphate symporter
MKDKRVFFNPIRMLSPKLDSEAIKIEELYKSPVSESLTLEEGLLVMLSKIIEMTRQARLGFSAVSMEEIEASDKLAGEVHQLEKLLTEQLACSLFEPPEICRAVILFPGHLERVGDYLESIHKCCKIKCRDGVPFTERAVSEVDDMFSLLLETMNNFRDAVIRPNKVLLENVIAEGKKLEQICQDLQLAHVERLLDGSTAPRASSLYLDVLESTQSINTHIGAMAGEIHSLMQAQENVA